MLKPVFETIAEFFGTTFASVTDGQATFITYLVAIVAGAVAFVASAIRHRMEHRNENSERFISGSDKEIVQALDHLGPLVRPGMALADKRAFIAGPHGRDYYIAVSHFEKVGVYMSIGLASERIVRRIEAGNICRLFIAIAPLLRDQRRSNPRILLYYECMFIRFFFGSTSLLAFMLRLVSSDRLTAARNGFLIYHWILSQRSAIRADYLAADIPAVRDRHRAFRLYRYGLGLVAIFSIWLNVAFP